VFRRRRFFAGRPIAPRRRPGGEAALPDIAWFTPAGEEMTEQDWDSGFGKSVIAFLNGEGIGDVDMRGERVTDDSFLLCFNAHFEDIDVTLPPARYGQSWGIVVDTATGEVVPLPRPGVVAEAVQVGAGGVHRVPARSLVVLQRVT
jgi:isoamylase